MLDHYFGKKLVRPIHLYFKVGQPEEKWKWPASWGPEKDRFGLGLHNDFNLEKTWWKMEGVDPKVTLDKVRFYSYETISHDEEACRKLQYHAMGLAKAFGRQKLLDWVSANSPNGYDPLKDERSADEVGRQLSSTMPLNAKL